MNELLSILQQEYNDHPDMEPQDAVKLLYQHVCGPGHLISDPEQALARLEDELDRTPASADAPLFQSVGGGLCRLNLAPCKALGLSASTLCRLFILTAQEFTPRHELLADSLPLILQLGFDTAAARTYLDTYLSQGCPMVRHSQLYRDAYAPAYRLVSEYYVRILPVLCAIDNAQRSHTRLRLAVDGPCASGKSTLGAALGRIYQCPLVHMDDFFLRPEQRTPERLAQPGGNVDSERFRRDVLDPLVHDRSVRYRPWLCQQQCFGPEITVPPSPLTVVEGCYCLREDLRDHFHLRIWAEADWSARRTRLLARGGKECLAQFESRWIVLENAYFDAQQVKNCCHIQLDLS